MQIEVSILLLFLLYSTTLETSIIMSTSTATTSDVKSSCWATLLTRTSYLAGALVMNASLIKHNSAYPLVVFATIGLPQDARDILVSQGIRVRDIEYLEPETKLELDGHDERFADTWTKLRCFEMVEYEVSAVFSI